MENPTISTKPGSPIAKFRQVSASIRSEASRTGNLNGLSEERAAVLYRRLQAAVQEFVSNPSRDDDAVFSQAWDEAIEALSIVTRQWSPA